MRDSKAKIKSRKCAREEVQEWRKLSCFSSLKTALRSVLHDGKRDHILFFCVLHTLLFSVVDLFFAFGFVVSLVVGGPVHTLRRLWISSLPHFSLLLSLSFSLPRCFFRLSILRHQLGAFLL